MNRRLAETVVNVSQALTQLFDDYRPERHYMRGPGPKWRAKRQGMATASMLPRDDAVALPEVASARI